MSPAKIYTGSPPPGTPIPPGTQIILSEGMSGGMTKLGKLSLSPVALPLHPLPKEEGDKMVAASPLTITSR